MSSTPNARQHSGNEGAFTATHWTLVLLAGQGAPPEADAALASLCQRYWKPLYCYVRRLGHTAEDAQDLVQGFFARLLAKNYLKDADPGKGRFRTFLLITLKRYLANEWDRAKRQKRGGGLEILPLDSEDVETRYLADPAISVSPEKCYDQQWALSLLARVLDRLEQEYDAGGKRRTFRELKVFLTGDRGEVSYAETARKLGLAEGAVKITVHRLRQRYGAMVRKEIAETVASPEMVDEELRHLLAALS